MKAIDFTYDFLFSKNGKGEYNHIIEMDKTYEKNLLYGKEIFIPAQIVKGRDYLFQALGHIGAYGNNEHDESIHYLFMPDRTIDALMLGIKDDFALYIEDFCTKQKASYKDPGRWRFRLKFIIEHEVISFIRERGKKVGSELETKQIEEYVRINQFCCDKL